MRRTTLLMLASAVLIALIFISRSSQEVPSKVETLSSQIETDLQVALKRLREASAEEQKARSSLTTDVMTLADALEDVGDTRQKQTAHAVKKEVGRLLFGEESPASRVASSTSGEAQQIVRFPGPLPELQFTPLPLQSYVGTYSGALAGRPVSFIITVTNRGLLGVQIVGLDNQPTFEFAEMKPQEFFRPDSKAVLVFADATEHGFRALYFQQHGMREKAENTSMFFPQSNDSRTRKPKS